MKKEISYKDSVKEAIVIALIQLMKEKEFIGITINEIVVRAGVARSSFYRNFRSKEDVLLYHANELYDIPEEEHEPYQGNHLKNYMVSRFRAFKENRDFFMALKQNHLLYLLYQQAADNAVKNIATFGLYRNPYQAVFFSSAAVGVTIRWIENDFHEGEEQLTDMFLYLMDGYHRQTEISHN